VRRAAAALLTATAVAAMAWTTAADHPEETAPEVYSRSCAACHGPKLEGGRASSLVDGVWMYGGDRDSVARSIRDGQRDVGMPAYGDSLSEAQVGALADLVLAKEKEASSSAGQ